MMDGRRRAAASAWTGISKRYGGVRALEQADLAVERRPHPRDARRERRRQVDADQDHVRRRAARRRHACRSTAATSAFADPAAANAAGIVCIFQELSLIPDLSVADNIVISRSAAPLRPDRPAAPSARIAEEALARAGAEDIHPAGARSRTCRCRAGRWSRSPRRWRASPRLLILDEATSALTARRRRQGVRAC